MNWGVFTPSGKFFPPIIFHTHNKFQLRKREPFLPSTLKTAYAQFIFSRSFFKIKVDWTTEHCTAIVVWWVGKVTLPFCFPAFLCTKHIIPGLTTKWHLEILKLLPKDKVVFLQSVVCKEVHWEFKPIFLDLHAPEVFLFATDWLCWVATFQGQTLVHD